MIGGLAKSGFTRYINLDAPVVELVDTEAFQRASQKETLWKPSSFRSCRVESGLAHHRTAKCAV